MQKLNIALIGFGKMGQKIAALAPPHQIIGRWTPAHSSCLSEADVWIDFSHPDGVVEHVLLAAKWGKPLVIGTTGWEKDLASVKEMAKEIGVFYSPNYSLGVHLFARLLKRAAELLKNYEAAGVEVHHSCKVDKPSGTAKLLSQAVPGVHFSSVRCGSLTGQHTVIFDSEEDTITLSHQAKTRDAYALGALRAAEWIMDKRGFFTMDDFLEEKCASILH
jgi:4-hydroxy-tetrahydrodipicolinate reductase